MHPHNSYNAPYDRSSFKICGLDIIVASSWQMWGKWDDVPIAEIAYRYYHNIK